MAIYCISLLKSQKRDTINDTLNDTLSGTLNGTINDTIMPLYELIRQNPGKRSPFFIERLKRSKRTIKRQLTELSELVEYRGAKRSGGYYLRSDRQG